VTDLTYVATWSGVAYVCFIVDAFSRMIVGWRVASHMRAEMVLDALEMARWSRGIRLAGLIAHSDAGSLGGFNWWLHHLNTEVVGGGLQASAGPGDQGDAGEGLVSGAAFDGKARAQGSVLGSDRSGPLERGCRGRGGHVVGGWDKVVVIRRLPSVRRSPS